jgi:hypothetical protein
MLAVKIVLAEEQREVGSNTKHMDFKPNESCLGISIYDGQQWYRYGIFHLISYCRTLFNPIGFCVGIARHDGQQ